jgi:hypothetical protein
MERMGITMTTPPETMTASAQAGSVAVSVSASENADGSVACAVTCNGRSASVTFTPTDVLIDVPEGQ